MNIEELNTALAQIFASDDLLINEPMSKHTTFRCGGPARFFVRASNAADITAAINAAEKADTPWWIVGGGSDLLVSDAGLPGVVIEIGERMAHISIDESVVRVQAGATNEAVAQAALEAGLTGYEFASGIPGSVGGAAIMNAGAYDGEFKDVAASVSCLFPDGTVREIPAEKADWSYRHSMMSDEGLVVLGATLQLAAGNKEDIRAKMDDLAQGHSVGDAQVSTKHAGFVVNTGNATAADVLQVIRDVQAAVADQFGVTLETEVRMWGFEPTDN